VLTLILIPTLYGGLEQLRDWMAGRRTRASAEVAPDPRGATP
jgi:hypothetical protein